MKKKSLVIVLIILLVIFIGFFIIKNAFVTATDEMPNAETSTPTDIKEYGERHQVEDLYDEENVPKLTQAEKELLAKVYTHGDVNQDGYVNGEDAQAALKLYVDTRVAHSRNYQTKVEVFTGDIDGDGLVLVEDAQLLLRYDAEYTTKGPAEVGTLEEYVARYLAEKNSNN